MAKLDKVETSVLTAEYLLEVETIVMSWWDSLPKKMQEELRNVYDGKENE
tara:strand:- start:198 stop:347 length:150 start_codon:yes stop_codon:yes gene_type:complete